MKIKWEHLRDAAIEHRDPEFWQRNDDGVDDWNARDDGWVTTIGDNVYMLFRVDDNHPSYLLADARYQLFLMEGSAGPEGTHETLLAELNGINGMQHLAWLHAVTQQATWGQYEDDARQKQAAAQADLIARRDAALASGDHDLAGIFTDTLNSWGY